MLPRKRGGCCIVHVGSGCARTGDAVRASAAARHRSLTRFGRGGSPCASFSPQRLVQRHSNFDHVHSHTSKARPICTCARRPRKALRAARSWHVPMWSPKACRSLCVPPESCVRPTPARAHGDPKALHAAARPERLPRDLSGFRGLIVINRVGCQGFVFELGDVSER